MVTEFIRKYWPFIFSGLIVLGGIALWVNVLFFGDKEIPKISTALDKPENFVPNIYAEEKAKAGDVLVSPATNQESPYNVAYSENQIIVHHTREDCWIVIGLEVYNVSSWEYPGDTDIAAICGDLENGKAHFEADNQPKPPIEEYYIGIYLKDGPQ